jgi:hypothetical protein
MTETAPLETSEIEQTESFETTGDWATEPLIEELPISTDEAGLPSSEQNSEPAPDEALLSSPIAAPPSIEPASPAASPEKKMISRSGALWLAAAGFILSIVLAVGLSLGTLTGLKWWFAICTALAGRTPLLPTQRAEF